jgi:hypothetical protein
VTADFTVERSAGAAAGTDATAGTAARIRLQSALETRILIDIFASHGVPRWRPTVFVSPAPKWREQMAVQQGSAYQSVQPVIGFTDLCGNRSSGGATAI